MTPVENAVGLPAPFWFIELFKILGFLLHSIPMHIWLVGLPLAVMLLLIGGQNAKRFSRRLFKQFPIVIALGINFGIVPLLFVQTAYYKAFYPSTILMAIHWMAILLLVMIAYYLLYSCSFLIENPSKRWTLILGTVASCCFIACGLIFSSAWTLMASPSDWGDIWEKTSIGGAVTGLGTYWDNPLVYYRFGSVIGLAFLTMAFWVAFDSVVLCKKLPPLIHSIPTRRSRKSNETTSNKDNLSAKNSEQLSSAVKTESTSKDSSLAKMSKKEKRRALKNGTISKEEYDAISSDQTDEVDFQNSNSHSVSKSKNPGTLESYRNWTLSLASCLAWIGMLIAAPTLYFYFEQTIPAQSSLTESLGDHLFYRVIGNSWILLQWGTLSSLLLPAFLLLIGKRFFYRGFLVFCLLISELIILTFFATIRQIIQNYQLIDYWNVAQLDSPSSVQWNPLICFLSVLVFGLLVIFWMIRQMVVASRTPKS
ncbi:MAG: hypothetical protein Q4C95_02480 [Planctomycetia bacterium]|nr:hypothetical protein [Planctomycetia bacterium]